MSYVTTRDDTKLFTKQWGTGKPVILIHGWPLNADSWDDVALGLAGAGFRGLPMTGAALGALTSRGTAMTMIRSPTTSPP
jgi:non-heme chloroperoxidase